MADLEELGEPGDIEEGKIGDGLVRIGAMSQEQMDDVLRRQQDGDDRLFGDIAIQLGYIDDKAITGYFNDERMRAIEALHRSRDELEVRVQQRTAELTQANERLEAEIAERKRAEKELIQLARFDPLTGLANRTLFQERLEQALSRADRLNQLGAMMFVDLDRFKTINDSLGHNVGDLLLKSVGARIVDCLRSVDTVARWGGDEFAVILEDIKSEQDIVVIGERVITHMENALSLSGHELFITVSIGITIFPNDGEDVDTLMKHADITMYTAKDQGRNNYQFYSSDMNAQAHERLSLETRLRRALERDEFLLYYQPKVSVSTGQMVGMEALIRWELPDEGLVSPAKFIPLAEETGMIVAIGDWALQTACADNRSWQEQGLPEQTVSVNISARQFRHNVLLNCVARALENSSLNPRFLELEITEGLLIENPEESIELLGQLKAQGLSISIDDFGTGYSSLSYLQRLPADAVKIDRSFVVHMLEDDSSSRIVTTIASLGRDLGLHVVAEGVETEEQRDALRELGCHYAQGFLYSRPLPVEEASRLIEAKPDG